MENAIVTGSAKGIGLAISKALLNNGRRILATLVMSKTALLLHSK